MQNRQGVSLVEVLVAAVLLAIGIGGSLQALTLSSRLRVEADAREALAGLMLDRLAWFEARACTASDTAGVTRLARGDEAYWRLYRSDSTRVLELEGRRGSGADVQRKRVVASLKCA